LVSDGGIWSGSTRSYYLISRLVSNCGMIRASRVKCKHSISDCSIIIS
jgi:hypothetical protein